MKNTNVAVQFLHNKRLSSLTVELCSHIASLDSLRRLTSIPEGSYEIVSQNFLRNLWKLSLSEGWTQSRRLSVGVDVASVFQRSCRYDGSLPEIFWHLLETFCNVQQLEKFICWRVVCPNSVLFRAIVADVARGETEEEADAEDAPKTPWELLPFGFLDVHFSEAPR